MTDDNGAIILMDSKDVKPLDILLDNYVHGSTGILRSEKQKELERGLAYAYRI